MCPGYHACFQQVTIGKVPLRRLFKLAKIVQSHPNRYKYAHEEYQYSGLMYSVSCISTFHLFGNRGGMAKKDVLLGGVWPKGTNQDKGGGGQKVRI